MKKMNQTYLIGIDHGYGNMKTANCCFPTGVVKSDTEPTFVSDLLEWNGKYYSVGVGHKEFKADKFNDEDYYVLTLAAIARELWRERITEADVYIAAGQSNMELSLASTEQKESRAYAGLFIVIQGRSDKAPCLKDKVWKGNYKSKPE